MGNSSSDSSPSDPAASDTGGQPVADPDSYSKPDSDLKSKTKTKPKQAPAALLWT
ncbi:hypothetical protein [Verrucomicrobium spinosum]|nr:hypothetical protein [Verrucomicrobium spinosum]